jgi:hypothetical protein
VETEVTIIGGGWSASRVNLGRARGLVIGVNDAALLAPRVDINFSMDRLWVENRWERLAALQRLTYVRKGTLRNVPDLDRVPDWVKIFDCDVKTAAPSTLLEQLNGDNSGTCAMNLAYRRRPRRLWLLGLDFARGPGGEPYWYPPYPWAPAGATKLGRYKDWTRSLQPLVAAFKEIDCRVIAVTTSPAMKMFERWTPERFNAYR